MRQAEKRRLRNKSIRSYVKTMTKKVLLAIKDNASKEEVLARLVIAQKAIDKAVSKGVFHRNEGARRKSRLMSRVNKYLAQTEEK